MNQMDWIVDTYRSFAHVVADNQFSALGLVLVGELAKVRKFVGATPPEAQSPMQRSPGLSAAALMAGPADAPEDLGEAVSRPPTTDQVTEPLQPQDRAPKRIKTKEKAQGARLSTVQGARDGRHEQLGLVEDVFEAPHRPPKKKKRKGKNAIDDLFSGLA